MDLKKDATLSTRSRILEIIRNNDDIFKAEIARITNLSIPTIMRITNEFIESGFVKITGKGISKGGKPPETLQVIPESRYFAGVDLSDSTITSVILDLKGNIVSKNNISVDNNMKNNKVINMAAEILDVLIKESEIDRSKLYGVGIGVPGIVDPARGVANSQSLGLEDFDIGRYFRDYFAIESFVENTPKAAAVAEHWYGSGRGYDNFIMLAFGRGIGSAMMVNGEIYRGMHNMSGEFGHMVVDLDGPLCHCGKKGCLETVASSSAIERQARQLLQEGFSSIMRKMTGEVPESVSAQIVMAAAEQGDTIALMIAEKAIKYIVLGIENLVSLLDINYIVLSGRILKQSPWFLAEIEKGLQKSKTHFQGGNVKLALSKLGNDAAAIGAATLPLDNFIRSFN